MNLHYFNVIDRDLDDLIVLEDYQSGDPKKLIDRLSEQDKIKPIANISVPCEDICLKLPEGKKYVNDIDNIIKIHQALSGIPRDVAYMWQFWAWFIHAYQCDYVMARSSVERKQYTWNDVKRIFFAHSYGNIYPQRAIWISPIPQLWLVGDFLCDADNTDDPYHFVRTILSGNADDQMEKSGSSVQRMAVFAFMQEADVRLGILDGIKAYIDYCRKWEPNNRFTQDKQDGLCRYFDSIAPTEILSMYPRNVLRQKTLEWLQEQDEKIRKERMNNC